MDHLPAPIDGKRPDVHFYAKKRTYRPDDFFTLPGDEGYIDFQLLLEDGLYNTIDAEEANVFLQSWLFFALLAQVLGEEIDYAEFYESDDTTLTTRTLNMRLQEWAKRETAALEEGLSTEQKNRYLRASMALTDARRFVSKHCSYQRTDRDHIILVGDDTFKKDRTVHNNLNDKMTLSLAILGETLQQARPDMIPHLEGHMGFWRDPRTEEKRWGCSKWCRTAMEQNGYSERDIHRMESIMPSVSVIYYASSISDLRQRSNAVTNGDTTELAKPLGPLHMGRCHDECPTKTVGEEKLVEIIERGQTPLVTFGTSGLEYKGYDLTKDCDLKFGALSHSWDGNIVDAGKDARNKNNRRMHRCQIKALQETLNNIARSKHDDFGISDMPFWVDVLCLPREPEPKGKAINQIRNIYSKATAVLVWDRDLLKRPKISEADMIQMNIRIRTSQWSWRLWTLQETILAGQHNLYVGFADQTTVSIDELKHARTRAKANPNDPYHHIWKAGYPFSQPTWELRNYEEFRIHRTWLAVQFRLVTMPQDEALIIASVLGLDVTRIQKIDGRQKDGKRDPMEYVAARRMVKLLDLIDQTPSLGVPSGIIFLPPCSFPPEVKEARGYSWAPSTWLSKQAHSYPLFRPERQIGSIGKHGLFVHFPGLVLHCPNQPVVDHKFWIAVHQCMHKWFKVVADTRGVEWKKFWSEEISSRGETSIIMSTRSPRDKWEVGLLVRSKGVLSQGEYRWVERLCRVWFRLETNSNVITKLVQGVREKGNGMLFGERLGDDQKWCIDGGS
jgi:hypothetical protein